MIRTQHRSWTPLCWFTFSKCLYHSISDCPGTHTINWRNLSQMWMLKPREEEEPFVHQTKLTLYQCLQPPAQVLFPTDNQEHPKKNLVPRISPNSEYQWKWKQREITPFMLLICELFLVPQRTTSKEKSLDSVEAGEVTGRPYCGPLILSPVGLLLGPHFLAQKSQQRIFAVII